MHKTGRVMMSRRRVDIMHTSNRMISATLLSLLCISGVSKAAPPNAPLSSIIEITPDSRYLDLDTVDRDASVRQTTTPVRITMMIGSSSVRPIEVYACIATEEAMRLSGKPSTLAASSLRIRNDRGEWAALEPMAELNGRRGVRVAILNKVSSTILLQVQLQVPTGQAPGTYEGVLMLEAQEQ
jgi:hypothetical protein